jgi:hypothetical protein
VCGRLRQCVDGKLTFCARTRDVDAAFLSDASVVQNDRRCVYDLLYYHVRLLFIVTGLEVDCRQQFVHVSTCHTLFVCRCFTECVVDTLMVIAGAHANALHDEHVTLDASMMYVEACKAMYNVLLAPHGVAMVDKSVLDAVRQK